jgi:PAS domain S-box-containing protein
VAKHEKAVKVADLIAAAVELSEDAIIGGTLEGMVMIWNPAAERMYGYSGKEVIGKPCSLLTTERAYEMDAVLVRVKHGETVEHLPRTLATKDGSVVAVSLTVGPVRNEEGVIVGVCTIHRDVTEQERSFEVAQRMQAIVEGSDDAIIGRTLEGSITSWNPAAEKMYGYSSQEILGKSINILVAKDQLSEIESVSATIRGAQHGERLETSRIRRNGTQVPVSITASPIRDAGGAITGVSAIHRDLTEQEQGAHYARSLIEADLDPLVAISPEGKISDVNEAAVKITGQPREVLIGSDFAHYVTDPDQARQYFQQTFEKGSVTDIPLTVRHRDGTLTDILCNASVYRDTNDKVLGVVAVARDAAQLHLQEQLSEQLQGALESRIILEQAKGMTAQRHGIRIEQAYQRMRSHARNNNVSLRMVAEAIVEVGLEV